MVMVMVMEKEQNFSEIEIAAIRFCLKHNNTTVFVQTMEALTQNITMVVEACARVSSFSFKYKKFPSQRCNVLAIPRDFVFLRKSTRFFAKWQRWKCNCDPRRYSIIITWRCQTVHWMICFVKNQRCSIITQECTVLYKETMFMMRPMQSSEMFWIPDLFCAKWFLSSSKFLLTMEWATYWCHSTVKVSRNVHKFNVYYTQATFYSMPMSLI